MDGWICEGCGYVAGEEAAESCPECGGNRFAFVKEGIETVGPREVASTVMGGSDDGDGAESGESVTGTLRELASNPTVRWLAVLAVLGGGLGIAVAFGGIDLTGALSDESGGVVGIDTDCSRQSPTLVACTHDIDIQDSTLDSGVLVVRYTDGDEILEEHHLDLVDLEPDTTTSYETTLEGSPPTLVDYEVTYDLVEMDWAD
ncbi:MAG: hypothetical protein ACOC0X_07410 [Halobacteriota archaeon]